MISDYLFPMLQERFPGRGLRISQEPKPTAMFPGIHPEFGDILIEDDGDGITLFAGTFTHGHFPTFPYDQAASLEEHDQGLSLEEKETAVAEDVASFLGDVFGDRVLFWGSHLTGGGWVAIDAFSLSKRRRFVWSGPIEDS